MTTLYSARWVLPVSSPPIGDGAIAVEEGRIIAVSTRADLLAKFAEVREQSFGEAAIVPGFVNAHCHLELTAMRGFLDGVEGNFFAWLKKLTVARLQRMTSDDLNVSAMWGACEALRAGVTCVADASDAAAETMKALREVGLRGTVFQESFGPDPKLARENFEKLERKVSQLRGLETPLVRVGVSPHAPYTVCPQQLEMIADYALAQKLPVMMHAAESAAEEMLLKEGRGSFAEGFAARDIEWQTPAISSIAYLARHGVLRTQPLLAHCINVDNADIEIIAEAGARIAHCPKSNAKLGHGRAPFASFLAKGVAVGLGSDSVASNNTCDMIEEGRFALLMARSGMEARSNTQPESGSERRNLAAQDVLQVATMGGARAVGLEGEVGELRAGLQADFAVISLAGTHQLPSYDPVSTLIFSSAASEVVLTVVAGREVYSEGMLPGVDEERLRARIDEIAEKLNA